MENLLEVKGLTKNYPGFTLQPLSFSLPGGSIMGFVGENGAGKTTTIKAILGLIRPDGGSIRLLGQPMEDQNLELKAQLGVVFDENCLPDNLTLASIDRMLGRIYRSRWDRPRFAALCSQFALPQDKEVKTFSRGMKMKLSIAAALAHRPRLLILDEATSGLDPIVRDEILDVFYDFIRDEEHSILFSTHITSDLEKIADYITFLHQGSKIFSLPKDQLTDRYGVARCTAAQLAQLPQGSYLRRMDAGSAGQELLVEDRAGFSSRWPQLLVEPANIEQIMLFYAKGERI